MAAAHARKPSATAISPLMRRVSAYVAAAPARPLPAYVIDRAKLHIVDTFAAMISGSRLLPGRHARSYVESLGGKPESGVVGTRLVTSTVNAALANAMAAHADETDDTHPPSVTHPGMTIIPAALAMGERQRASGQALLRAVALGYDICPRVSLALGARQFMSAGHYTVAFGAVFGAGATAAALLKLDAHKVRYMFSYAAQQAAGLSAAHRDVEHVQKSFAAAGMGTQNGVSAALMAAHGFTGVEDIFSGEENFFFTFATPNGNPDALIRGLGKDYELMRTGIKPFAAGGPVQAPLHMLLEAIEQDGLKPGQVEKLVVRMPDRELEVVSNRDMPDICVQHLLAVMLLDGKITFESAHDSARMRDRKVLAIRKRIEAVGDPSLTDPLRRWRCAMRIHLKNGRTLVHETMAAKGGLDNPLSRAEGEKKALDLMAPVLGKKTAGALIAAIWNLDNMKDVRALRSLYAR